MKPYDFVCINLFRTIVKLLLQPLSLKYVISYLAIIYEDWTLFSDHKMKQVLNTIVAIMTERILRLDVYLIT